MPYPIYDGEVPKSMEKLKLLALDANDLEVVSAHLHDGVIRTGEIAYLPKERKFAFTIRRIDWDGESAAPSRQRLTGVHFERVVTVRSRGIDRSALDEPLTLMAMLFRPGDAPSGTVSLLFSDDRAIEIDLECIEMQMKDIAHIPEAEVLPEHSA